MDVHLAFVRRVHSLTLCRSCSFFQPFLPGMTESELHAIMTGGFATIAGSVYGIYISFGTYAHDEWDCVDWMDGS
jgi:nucleoside permease NupC